MWPLFGYILSTVNSVKHLHHKNSTCLIAHIYFLVYLFSCIFIFFHIYSLPYLFSYIFIFLYIYFLPYLFSSIFILFHIYFLPYLFSSMLIFFHIYFLVYRLNHYKCLSYNYQGHLLNFNNTYNFILLI